MIFYHVDRFQSLNNIANLDYCLKSNTQPYGSIFNELSSHGFNYFVRNDKTDLFSLYEIVLEYVRVLKYSNMPSRFKSLFASKHLNDTLFWVSYCCNANQPFNLVTIESNNYVELDCSWFTMQNNTHITIPSNINPKSIAAVAEIANNYWRGLKTNTPINEVLIPLPCKIIKIKKFINIEEFIRTYSL